MAEWTFADGRKLTFTGEFGGEYKSADTAPWIIPSDIPPERHTEVVVTSYSGRQSVRLGPREQWDELPVRGNPWPEPEDDYEALGYPETEVGFEMPALCQLMVSTLHECLSASARIGYRGITKNDVDTDNG